MPLPEPACPDVAVPEVEGIPLAAPLVEPEAGDMPAEPEPTCPEVAGDPPDEPPLVEPDAASLGLPSWCWRRQLERRRTRETKTKGRNNADKLHLSSRLGKKVPTALRRSASADYVPFRSGTEAASSVKCFACTCNLSRHLVDAVMDSAGPKVHGKIAPSLRVAGRRTTVSYLGERDGLAGRVFGDRSSRVIAVRNGPRAVSL